MKRLLLLLICFILAFQHGNAQSPQKMSYQCVIRNAANGLVTSSPVGIRISILQGSSAGSSVYTETHSVNTNSNGLATIEIGGGTGVSGSFGLINWANGPYFIKSETDPAGGTTYSISAVAQLLSVPYALYAETSGTPGPTGPQGPIGLTGATGPSGATGSSGANGISVTSSAVFGDSLFITLSNGQILNAGYVTGAQGIQGPIGLTGTTGSTGPQGPIGLTGATGLAGTAGPTGLTGATGPQGPIGLTGATGPQGIQGTIGATGPQGPIGLTGAIGATGSQGPTGLTGATGQQGIQGTIGATGPQGPIGLTGAMGATGSQGPIGLTGATGQQGPIGNDGPTGPQGIQGLTGATGPIGAAGPTGPQGSIGNNGIGIASTQVIGDNLYIDLSSGQTLNAGNVRGATGLQGAPGNANMDSIPSTSNSIFNATYTYGQYQNSVIPINSQFNFNSISDIKGFMIKTYCNMGVGQAPSAAKNISILIKIKDISTGQYYSFSNKSETIYKRTIKSYANGDVYVDDNYTKSFSSGDILSSNFTLDTGWQNPWNNNGDMGAFGLPAVTKYSELLLYNYGHNFIFEINGSFELYNDTDIDISMTPIYKKN